MSIKTKNFFPGYIGQAGAVAHFNEMLTLEEKGFALTLRAQAFTGEAGLGKTEFAKRIAEAREGIHGAEHRFLCIAPGITAAALIKDLAQNANNRPATIFIDEAHDLKPGVRNMLKPILETGGRIEDVKLSEECIFTSNPFQHLWVSASNEDLAAKDAALWGSNGRFSRQHFFSYSDADKAALLRLSLGAHEESGEAGAAIKIDADAVQFLIGRVWGNARSITQEMGPLLRNKALIHGGKINLAFAKAFCAGELHEGLTAEQRDKVKRYPRGLLWEDIEALSFMDSDKRGKLVSEVANRVGLPAKTMAERLRWLAGELGFVATHTSGRKVLALPGAEYLAAKKAADVRAQAAKKGAKTKEKAATAAK